MNIDLSEAKELTPTLNIINKPIPHKGETQNLVIGSSPSKREIFDVQAYLTLPHPSPQTQHLTLYLREGGTKILKCFKAKA